jgi:DNA-binding MarR family transcriptional regulator
MAADPEGDSEGEAEVARLYGKIEVQAAVLTRNFELLRRRAAHPDELDRAEYLILRALARLGPSSINELADALGLDPSTVGRQVAALEEAGLIGRTQDPQDRRRAIVASTAVGRRRMNLTSSKRTARTRDLLADWTPEELSALAEAFAHYNQAVARRHLADTPTEASEQSSLPAEPRRQHALT